MHTVRLASGVAAAIVLALSLVAHAAAIAGIDVESVAPSVWWLHGASMLVFALALIVTLRAAPAGNARLSSIIRLVPAWAFVLIVLMLVYALANFVWLSGATGGGAPIVGGGKFAFNDHGRIREVTEAAFHAERAAAVRLYSAMWLYLSLIATLYLMFARPAATAPKLKATTSLRR